MLPYNTTECREYKKEQSQWFSLMLEYFNKSLMLRYIHDGIYQVLYILHPCICVDCIGFSLLQVCVEPSHALRNVNVNNPSKEDGAPTCDPTDSVPAAPRSEETKFLGCVIFVCFLDNVSGFALLAILVFKRSARCSHYDFERSARFEACILMYIHCHWIHLMPAGHR